MVRYQFDDAFPYFNYFQVAETCQLAARRIEWLQAQENNREELPENPYLSTDPAPPETVDKKDIPQLKETLLNQSLPLFERYRAMFSLRNLGTTESVLALAEGIKIGISNLRFWISYCIINILICTVYFNIYV